MSPGCIHYKKTHTHTNTLFTEKPGQVCAMQPKQHLQDGQHSLKWKGSVCLCVCVCKTTGNAALIAKCDSSTGSRWALRRHLISIPLYGSCGQQFADSRPVRWVHPGDTGLNTHTQIYTPRLGMHRSDFFFFPQCPLWSDQGFCWWWLLIRLL